MKPLELDFVTWKGWRWVGWVVLAGPALAHLVLLAIAIAGRFGYPYDLEWMEGGMLHHAQRIEDALLGVPRLRHQEEAGDERGEHERHVDEEHGAEGEVGQDQPARHRPHRAGGAGHAGPDGDRLGALLRVAFEEVDRYEFRGVVLTLLERDVEPAGASRPG